MYVAILIYIKIKFAIKKRATLVPRGRRSYIALNLLSKSIPLVDLSRNISFGNFILYHSNNKFKYVCQKYHISIKLWCKNVAKAFKTLYLKVVKVP